MNKSKLIIITGMPGIGKTTLAKQIEEKLKIPFIYKDGIKEILFDTLGWSDRGMSKKLGASSFALIYYFLENLLKVGQSVLVEANFINEIDSKKMDNLKEKYDFDIYQIYCFTSPVKAYKRFNKRVLNKERHPGHVDHHTYESFKKSWADRNYCLNINAKIIDVDMSIFKRISIDNIIKELS